MVSVHFCKLRLLKNSVNIYATSSSLPFTGPQQLLHGLRSPQLPPRPKRTFFFLFPTKDLRRWIRDFSWATAASLLWKQHVWTLPSLLSGEGAGGFNSLWILSYFWYFGSWGCLEMPYMQRGLSRFVSDWFLLLCLHGDCFVAMNLLLVFFLWNMDSWGSWVTHVALPVFLTLRFKNLYKNTHTDTIVSFSLALLPPVPRPLLLHCCWGRVRSWCLTHRPSEAQRDSSQLPRRLWDFSFMCIELDQGTQRLYLFLFYWRISSNFVWLAT